MTESYMIAILWAVAAAIVGMLPKRHDRDIGQMSLIFTGIPLLGMATLQYGPWIALVMLVAGLGLLAVPFPKRAAHDATTLALEAPRH